MKRLLFEIGLAFVIGAFSCAEAYALYGVVSAYTIEKHIFLHLHKWIYYLPKAYRGYAALVHGIAELLFIAIPLIALLGGALGLFISKGPSRYGILAACGAISSDIFIAFYTFGDFVLPVWVYVTNAVIWMALFILFTNVGYRLRKRRPTA